MKVSALPLFVALYQLPFVSMSMAQTAPSVMPIQPLSEISSEVHTFIQSSHQSADDLSISVKPLDKRLRLTQCSEPLSAQWASGSRELGRVSVQVHCQSPKPWRLLVQATVTVQGKVWSLARGVRRGEALSRELLVHRSVTLGAANPSLSAAAMPVVDIDPLIGFVFSRQVRAGKVLDERMLKPALLIQKGKVVIIRHRSAGLSLQAKGIALDNAAVQQRVRVRNQSSGKTIDAVAVSKGVVEILN